MAGSIIRIIPTRLLDFSAVSSGFNQEIVLADRVDVSAWRLVGLLLRTNSSSVWGGEIDINAYLDTRADDDPGLLFTGPLVGTGSIQSGANYQMVDLDFDSGPDISEPLGAMVKVTAKGTRSSSGAIAALVSIELSCKTA